MLCADHMQICDGHVISDRHWQQLRQQVCPKPHKKNRKPTLCFGWSCGQAEKALTTM